MYKNIGKFEVGVELFNDIFNNHATRLLFESEIKVTGISGIVNDDGEIVKYILECESDLFNPTLDYTPPMYTFKIIKNNRDNLIDFSINVDLVY